MGTAEGRWLLAAAVLGSGVAFLDATVVNAALPAISADLGSRVIRAWSIVPAAVNEREVADDLLQAGLPTP